MPGGGGGDRLLCKEHTTVAIAVRETDVDVEAVKDALHAGHLTVEVLHGPHSCHHRLMYARCPSGHVAAIYPAQRDGVEIVALVMHCPHCNADFPAKPEDITLG